MPALSRTNNNSTRFSCEAGQHSTNNNASKSGFSLIEILLSLFFIAALVTILLTTSGSFLTRRQSNLQSKAAKAVSKEIERLRGLSFTALKSAGDLAKNVNCQNTAANNDLEGLPGGQLCRNLYNYNCTPPPPCASTDPNGTKIVGVVVTVYWDNENSAEQNVTMDTLIYEKGL